MSSNQTQRHNSLLMRALRREPVPRPPIWMMRQAGRYLPEYRKTRAKAGSFLALASNHELACEVTLQPIHRFGFDAAILFADILLIPDAMGLGLNFTPGEGPRFERPVRTEADIRALPRPDPENRLSYVLKAVRLIRSELDQAIPLIGFAGSPWTVATYMIEGGGSKDFSRAKRLLHELPGAADDLMTLLADTTTDYLLAQVRAGADALMIFDTWGGVLAPELYRRFSLAPQARIVERLKNEAPDVPIILFGKGCGQHLEIMADTGCAALGVDWTLNLADARARVGDRTALQGNLDPAILLTTPQIVAREARRVIDSFGPGPGHIFNLGHGITPDAPLENVEALVEAVQSP